MNQKSVIYYRDKILEVLWSEGAFKDEFTMKNLQGFIPWDNEGNESDTSLKSKNNIEVINMSDTEQHIVGNGEPSEVISISEDNTLDVIMNDNLDISSENNSPISIEVSEHDSESEYELNETEQPIIGYCEPESEVESSPVIPKLTIKINRQYIQGGLTNEEFGNHLEDWRLQHHFSTRYVCYWQDYRELERDARFSDIISNNNNNKAEGKNMTKGVTLCPSSNTGVGRSFNNENLCECFNINTHYYLYHRNNITDTTLDIIILWIPIATIRNWYSRFGRKGKISERNLNTLLSEHTFMDSFIDKSSNNIE